MTLRGRLLVAHLAMVLVPLGLVVALNAVLLSFVQEGAPKAPAFRWAWPLPSPSAKRPLPTRLMLNLTQTTLRRINVETMAAPQRLSEPAFWAGLDDALAENDAGLVVRRGEEYLFVSPNLGDPGVLQGLPAWGALEVGLPPGSDLAQGFRLLGQWDYPRPAQLSVFLLWVTQPWNTAVETFTVWLIGGFLVFTLAAGVILTWLVGRSLLSPLKRLQDAAIRIASGDLSPPPAHAPRDELAPLFEAFEAMRVKLEENRHLRERYEADRRDLIAHIAHDLKTPVTAIGGYVAGILDGVASTPEKQRQYLEVVAAKARDLDRRTDELVYFSSLELGTLPYEFQTFDLGDFLRDLWDELLVEYGPQGLSGPSPQLPEGALPLRGDPAKLRRLVANLADNTVKFRRGASVVWSWTLEVDGCYRLRLADDGVGIGSEALPHVFERFYREDGSRTRVPGTGLGLAIVQRIAQDHGGSVRASSGPGPGTVIEVELPLP